MTLSAEQIDRVRELAQRTRMSVSRVLADLIEAGLDARDDERARFTDLVDRLARSTNARDQSRIKEELARLTFGD